jgi:TetR/AcrR family transcriptional repressor of nem operon
MSDRRALILDAAASLLAERGYAHVSVDDVICQSGLSGKSHFYHYFRSKEQLAHEVIERQFERVCERGLAILREPMIAPLDRLALFIDTLVALQVERGLKAGSPFGAVGIDLAGMDEGYRQRVAVVFDRWATQLQSLLWEMRDELLPGTEARRLAHFIMSALEGAVTLSRVKQDASVMQGVAADLKRYVQAQVRPGGPRAS